MRIRLLSLIVVFAAVLCCAVSAHAGTVYQIRDGDTSGSPVYPSLAAFQAAIIANPAMLQDGDVIELCNDDYTLAAPLRLPTHLNLTIRSVGGQHTLYGGVYVPNTTSPDSHRIKIGNVLLTAGDYGVEGDHSTIDVSNSTITGNARGGMLLYGDTRTTLHNVVFTENDGVNAFRILATDPSENPEVDVIVDGNAPLYTHWASDLTGTAISITGAGRELGFNPLLPPDYQPSVTSLDFTIAGGKTLSIAGAITSTNLNDSYSKTDLSAAPPVLDYYAGMANTKITKNGDGVLKLLGSVSYTLRNGYEENHPDYTEDQYDLGMNILDIQQGTVHFGDKFLWYGFDVNQNKASASKIVNNGVINVGKNGTFKPSIAAGDLEERINLDTFTADASYFLLDRFTSEQGAKLEVGGISSMPVIGTNRVGNTTTTRTVWYQVASIADGDNSNTVKTLSVNNRLMEAYLELANWSSHNTVYPDVFDCLQLRIARVENLDTLEGVGSYADVYRRMEGLSEAERDMLDAIYARGGAGSDLGFLQTIGGQIVQNSLLALRHNQANLIGKINKRLTAYQKEELELEPQISGSEVCYYSDYDPVNNYNALWASIDQTWMTQRDVADMAGYRYNANSLTIGYDHHWDNMIAGGALNYSSGTMKLRNQTSTKNEVDSLMAALYASWAMDGWYVSGSLFAAHGWNDSESGFYLPGISSMTAKTGNYATNSIGVNSEFGYMMETDLVGIPLRVTPYGSLTFARMKRDAVRESGAGGDTVNMDRQFRSASWNAWDAAIGVRVAVPIEGNGYMLIPSIDAAWTRTMGDPTTSGGDAYFIKNPSAAWHIPFMGDSRNSVRLATSLDARFGNNVTAGLSYELEWRNQFWKNQLNLTASVDF